MVIYAFRLFEGKPLEEDQQFFERGGFDVLEGGEVETGIGGDKYAQKFQEAVFFE